MESDPALKAILAGVSDPAERQRIAAAFHSLSQGDERSFPVVFALVASGTARSVAQSAASIRENADRILSTPGLPAKHAVKPAESAPDSWKGKLMAGVAVGLTLAGLGSAACFLVLKNRYDSRAAKLAAQYAECSELVKTLHLNGGELRFYAGRNADGKTVRVLTIDGGLTPPLEAFLNSSGHAIILLNPLPQDPP